MPARTMYMVILTKTNNFTTGSKREQRQRHAAWTELRTALVSTHHDLKAAQEDTKFGIVNHSRTAEENSSEAVSCSVQWNIREPQIESGANFRVEEYLDAASLKAMETSDQEDDENMAPYNPSHLRYQVPIPYILNQKSWPSTCHNTLYIRRSNFKPADLNLIPHDLKLSSVDLYAESGSSLHPMILNSISDDRILKNEIDLPPK